MLYSVFPGVKQGRVLKCPVLTHQNQHLGEVILKSLKCEAIRHRKSYFNNTQTHVKAALTWKHAAE